MTEAHLSPAHSDGHPETVRGTHVVIQRNPLSGSGRKNHQLLILVRRLRQDGLTVRMFSNRERMDQYLADHSGRHQIRCLVAAGGDGTVANLVSRHPELPIAVFPLGTENLLAGYLKVPTCGETVAEMIREGKTRVFDTGFVGNQRFLIMVSAGVDANVVRQLHSNRQGHISRLTYLRPIISSFFRYRFPVLAVRRADGTLIGAGTHVIVSNLPAYGFEMPFSPEADPHDGLLNIRILKSGGWLRTVVHAIRMRLRIFPSEQNVLRATAGEITITCDVPGIPVQFDGDPAADCPARIRIAPQSMTLIVRSTKTPSQ
ncbi:MAG: diacylglycerol kinase family protein [Planctomycetaceae bacterium]